MEVSEIVKLLKGRLSRFTNASTKLDEFFEGEIRTAQTRLERRAALPSFLIKRVEGTVLQGQGQIELPPDMLRLIDSENSPVSIKVGSAWRPLFKEDVEFAEELYGAAGEDTPRCFVVEGDAIYLYPAADKTYPVRLRYYAAEPVLVSPSSQNKWTSKATELLMSEAGVILASGYLQHQEAVIMFEGLRREAERNLFAADAAKDMAGRSLTED